MTTDRVCTLLFDIDGTLMTSEGAGMGAMEIAAKTILGVDDVPNIRVHGRTDKSIVAELFAAIDQPDDTALTPFLAEYYRQLPEALNRQRGRVLAGVVELISLLAGDPCFALGILTGNLKSAAEIKLEHIGLRQYFAFGGYGDHDPDRNDVALRAVAEARASLGNRFCESNVWVIGDTVNDIRCGRHVNAKVVAVETGGGGADQLAAGNPDLQLANLAQSNALSAWIEAMQDSLEA